MGADLHIGFTSTSILAMQDKGRTWLLWQNLQAQKHLPNCSGCPVRLHFAGNVILLQDVMDAWPALEQMLVDGGSLKEQSYDLYAL